jgi:hypothetical protein
VLSGCGAVLGLIFAESGTRVLRHLDAFSIPLLESVQVLFYRPMFLVRGCVS